MTHPCPCCAAITKATIVNHQHGYNTAEFHCINGHLFQLKWTDYAA